MRRFISDVQIHVLQLPDENIATEELEFLLPCSAAGTLGEVSSLHSTQYLQIMSALETSLSLYFPVEVWTLIDTYLLGGVRSFELLDETETNYLGE